jgi:hypothetical protein
MRALRWQDPEVRISDVYRKDPGPACDSGRCDGWRQNSRHNHRQDNRSSHSRPCAEPIPAQAMNVIKVRIRRMGQSEPWNESIVSTTTERFAIRAFG